MTQNNADALIVVSAIGGIVFAFFSGFYYTDHGFAWWSETAKANRARNEKRDQLIREYLGYGFDLRTAKNKADAKMEADAKAADEVKV